MTGQRKGLPPLALYIHFPWCVAKCPYCDFNSHSLKGELPAATYIDALLLDLQHAAPELAGRPLLSVFLGGGTPSLFEPTAIDRLLQGVRTLFEFDPAVEVTLEANPGTIEHGAFVGYRAAGVNRLSLGVQSFSDTKLRSLGRIHNVDAVHTAFAEARAAGFTNINLDLMYALPDQSLAEARHDLNAAIALRPEHISYYHLTLEPNTVFFARPPALPDEDLAWDIQQQAVELLSSSGYQNYEISAWTSGTHECTHNRNYWRYGDYLGIGAGAHSKLTFSRGNIVREVRAAHPRDYLQRIRTQQAVTRSEVNDADRVFEFMLNNLRLRTGFQRNDFEQATALSADLLEPGIREATVRGLLEETADGQLRPSDRGWNFLDDLQALFLPASR